jgi:hypothetical protein
MAGAVAAAVIAFWTGIDFVTAAAVADFVVAAAIRPFFPSYARPPYFPH